MSGRLFAEPLLCSVIDLAAVPLEEFGAPWAVGLGLVGVLGLSAPGPTILSSESPGVHLIDTWAIADPLLARLPAEVPWRIGHFRRKAPDGYRETLGTGRNVIHDQDVAMYYEKLRIITQDPIWSRRRFRTILAMNLGRYEQHVKSYGLVRVSSDVVASPVPDGTPWDKAFDMTLRGVEVKWPQATRATALELSLSRNDVYRILFLRSGATVGERTIHQALTADGSLRTQIVQAPMRDEFDAVRVIPSGGDALYSLGHLRAVE